ncbi:ABC transporter permease [Xylophilus sp. GOD-11R]|uniref:ABC transporter permease n=1 Tax=Xylophilus sp. GOD-11R TaxID=3089814 RepID=UPI00298C6BDD|nr:ABC transporter permease [Xylophilus sp. GOD-11R]WPB57801.1 ABC transporter permease [Xylophilus sp. GOD-11R]
MRPTDVLRSLLVNRHLIVQLVRREISGRYRGSFLGVLWTFVNPLLMLAIYTFIFGYVFKSRWRSDAASPIEFSVVIFAGVMLHTLIAECINKAPTLIVGQTNFVKKVIFPLHCLAWVTVGSALFHTLISIFIFLVAVAFMQGSLSIGILWMPVLIAPFALMVAGVVWVVAALGVYLRDIGQLMGLMSSVLMFLAPIFYPLQSVPDRFRAILYLNPLTFVVEQVRAVAIWGQPVDWVGWCVYTAVSFLVAACGLTVFQRLRSGFADVL